jgi:glycosyltransferase involved in cell wall biosynthesis
LSKELAKQGHTVYLIAAGFTHLLRELPKLDRDVTFQQIDENFHFVWIRMPEYSDAHNIKRVFNWFRFAWKMLALPKFIADKPDVILVSSPAPFLFLGAKRLAKRFKARLAFEVRDIWPLSLIELSGYSPNHPFIRLMQWVEDLAYRNSDVVLSNLPNSFKHMVGRGMDPDKFAWIPNGFDFEEFENAHPLDPNVKCLLPRDKFIVGYTGTIGVANALDNLIEAAKLLKDEDDIAFVLVGGGKEKNSLIAKAKGLDNVFFIDPIPKKQIQSMLAEFDICFIGCQDVSLYRFGTAPNKIPEYMYSAKPVLQSCNDGYDYIKHAMCGMSVEPQNPYAIADAIFQLKSMSPDERQKLGKNGRAYALEHHDYARLAKKLAEVIS